MTLLNSAKTYKEEEAYFRGIYSIVKEYSFDNGEIKNGELILYNASFEILEKIPLANEKGYKLVRIIKDHGTEQIYFIMGGAVDDNYGIVFANRSSVDMDGIYLLERISGNSFYYETFRS